MSLATFFLARAAKLPRRRNRIRHQRHVRIPMRDEIHLEADVFNPRAAGLHPTILIRVPYGLKAFSVVGALYAERGYNVVVQACRGTDRSEGELDPLIHERDDGLDTVSWIKAQPWFDGRLGLTGESYMGYAAWAICDALPRQAALSIKASSAEFKSVVFPGGAFHLGLWLGWMQVMALLRKPPFNVGRRMASGMVENRTLSASMKLPLQDADRRATGREVPFWHRWLAGAIGNEDFWRPIDHTQRLGPRTPPTSLVSGWYDIMVDQLLRDYETLSVAGGKPELTVGPWWHISPELQIEAIRDTQAWMDAKLLGLGTPTRPRPVRIHISGTNEWRDFDAYPPGVPSIEIWNLHEQKLLAPRPVPSTPPDHFLYDPANPTPNLGGAIFAFTGAGPVDQAPLEKRNDVLLYTSDPLREPLTIIGNVRAVMYVRTSLPNADLFVRLSDVDETGKSINICDGILRRTAADPGAGDIRRLNFKLHATAHQFKVGHRLRVLVAGGAHPRYARNTGTDEPIGSATTLRTVDFDIFHDPEHPSAIHLPVYKL